MVGVHNGCSNGGLHPYNILHGVGGIHQEDSFCGRVLEDKTHCVYCSLAASLLSSAHLQSSCHSLDIWADDS